MRSGLDGPLYVLRGYGLEFLNVDVIPSLEIVLMTAKSVDPGEMTRSATFQLGFHFLSNSAFCQTPFRGFQHTKGYRHLYRVGKHVLMCVLIHCTDILFLPVNKRHSLCRLAIFSISSLYHFLSLSFPNRLLPY